MAAEVVGGVSPTTASDADLFVPLASCCACAAVLLLEPRPPVTGVDVPELVPEDAAEVWGAAVEEAEGTEPDPAPEAPEEAEEEEVVVAGLTASIVFWYSMMILLTPRHMSCAMRTA